MSQSVWQLSCQENYKRFHTKEGDANSVSIPFISFIFNSKSSSKNTLKHFIQENFKVVMKRRGPWTCSPDSGKICSPSERTLPALKGQQKVPAPSSLCDLSSDHRQGGEWLGCSWFHKEAQPNSEGAVFGLTVIHLIYRHPVLWWYLSVATEEYLQFQAIYCNRSNLFLVSTHRPSICWTFATDTSRPNWIRH